MARKSNFYCWARESINHNGVSVLSDILRIIKVLLELVLHSVCTFSQMNMLLLPLWRYGPLAVPHAVGLHHEGNKEHAVVKRGKYEIENE